jgi:hypothetical protein
MEFPFMPPVPPVEIGLILLTELVFGLGFNPLADWAQRNKIWHVSISVCIGVGITVTIPILAWCPASLTFWQAWILMMGCFAASGVPMIVGSTRRSVALSHKRHPLPTSAMKVRDDAVMDLNMLATEISEQVKRNQLSVRDLPEIVNRIHGIIGALKSV